MATGPYYRKERDRRTGHIRAIAVDLDHEIARGGEGAIFRLRGDAQYVAKIFLRDAAIRSAKIEAMVANPPQMLGYKGKKVDIAWPIASLFQNEQRIGFLMPYIDRKRSAPLFLVYNVRDRAKTYPEFTWKHLMRVAQNLAIILQALHGAGYVVGDLNESNILVARDATVTIIDCDSIQVPRGKHGKVFPCLVGKPEYLPPELQGKQFAVAPIRSPVHDTFGLAVLIFMLLMGGVHPFYGVWQPAGEPPPVGERIQRGLWPYYENSMIVPPPSALPLRILPRNLRVMMQRAFVEGIKNTQKRPTADEWAKVLAKAERRLHQCHKNPNHYYDLGRGVPRLVRRIPLLGRIFRRCPWCEREAQGIIDFPGSPI
jgi:DNA-binding helix-hairpin-helix protein with protein kinase domain